MKRLKYKTNMCALKTILPTRRAAVDS